MTGLLSFMGLRLIENAVLMVGPFEDWSDVRSPGRAKRRRVQGHPQRIKYFHKPDPSFYRYGDTLVAHPATMAHLRARHAQEQRGEGNGPASPQ